MRTTTAPTVRSRGFGIATWPSGIALAALALLAALAGCDRKPAAAAPAPPPPMVTVMQPVQRDTKLTGELVGEVRALREVDLRAQVSGIVTKQLFEPGQRVTEGQPLFVIDARQYESGVNEARATLADAQSALARARQDVARYEPLLPDNAIPRATYDAAVAQVQSAQAAVAARKAALARAQLDVGNTRVASPVTGQIGQQKVEVGGLVSAGQTVLATVSTLDPVLVHFSIPESTYLRYARAAASEQKQMEERPVGLILGDGSRYAHPGRIDFAERAIAATGTLAVRARFPNPNDILRPGLNVRVELIYEEVRDALLVPQRAVTELLGRTFVTVIGAGNKAEQRAVELGDRVGQLWLVRSGLKPNERIVVDGLARATPGAVVNPVPITEAQLAADGVATSPGAAPAAAASAPPAASPPASR